MKHLLFFIVCLCFHMDILAQNKVTVRIENIKNNKGVCQTCIFSSAASFEKMEPLQCFKGSIQNKNSIVVFPDVPDGTYAVFVFHDVNNNNIMDKNFLGIPREGYGASLNKLPFAAAPKFSENSFVLENNRLLNLTIRLRNM